MADASRGGIQERPTTAPALHVLAALFQRLHAGGVQYCHWKSNEHLQASLAGITDLDLLVDRRATAPLAQILSETDFKRFLVQPGRGYPGVEDYLGFDTPTGRLTHLHVHYQLTLGEKFLKGYRLPWEALALSTRVWDAEHALYVIDPHLEALLLVVRAALKLQVRDLLAAARGQPYFRGGMLRELRWLAKRVQPDRLSSVACRLIGDEAARRLLEIVAAPRPAIGPLVALRRSVEPPLSEYRMYGAVEARLRRWLRECNALAWRVRNRLLNLKRASSRTSQRGGLTIALVGTDGSGKSTVAARITEWLSAETAVLPIYGGSGKGAVSLPRRVLQLVAALARRRGPKRGRARRGQHMSRLRTTGEVLWVFALARERRRRFRKATWARNRGLIVIWDRFPQTEFAGFNEGPAFGHWLSHRSWFLRAAARAERAALRGAETHPPDLVIKLHVAPELAAQRRPGLSRTQLEDSAELIKQLSYPPTTRVFDLDANQPLERVVLLAKQAVWEAL